MVRWGILGAGNIARRFAQSLRHVDNATLAAISVRSRDKAEAFVKEYPAENIYIGHDALLADDTIDAVYLALPHGLHKQWAMEALAARKAVLCEKPAALSAAEVQDIADAARTHDTLFMEAMKTRFVPAYRHIRQLVADGTIGDIRHVEASMCHVFAFDAAHPTYHTQPGQGGALLDEGIYCANWLADYLSGDASVTDCTARLEGGVDYYVKADIRFANGDGRLTCAFDCERPRQAVLQGTKGRIVIEELHRPTTFTLVLAGQEPQEICHPYVYDDFYGEIRHFTELVAAGAKESDVMPLLASIRCAQCIDAIRARIGGV